MRLVIADRHTEVRWALRTALGQDPRLTLVGEVTEADHLFARVHALAPDLLLLEWELAGRSPVQLFLDLRRLDRPLRIIVLGNQPQVGEAALRAGADAFVSKSDPPERLLHTLGAFLKEAEGSTHDQ